MPCQCRLLFICCQCEFIVCKLINVLMNNKEISYGCPIASISLQEYFNSQQEYKVTNTIHIMYCIALIMNGRRYFNKQTSDLLECWAYLQFALILMLLKMSCIIYCFILLLDLHKQFEHSVKSQQKVLKGNC